MNACPETVGILATIGSFCVTEALVKVVFAFICIASATAGSALTIWAGDTMASAMPPEFKEWPSDIMNQTFNHTIARGERLEALRISSITSRIGIVVLFLSVATGLIINFPSLTLAFIGVAAVIATTAFGIWYGTKVPALRYRIRVWKRIQHLGNITDGNVIGQDAIVQLVALLKLRREKVLEAEAFIDRLIAEEELRIAERGRQMQAATAEQAAVGGPGDAPS